MFGIPRRLAVFDLMASFRVRFLLNFISICYPARVDSFDTRVVVKFFQSMIEYGKVRKKIWIE